VSVSDLYFPRTGPHISCSRIGRLIVGIYKSLTDTVHEFGNWDCGHAILFWEYLFRISVLVLCSVDVEGRTKRLEEGSRKGSEDTRMMNRMAEESEQIRYKKAAGEGSGRWEGGEWEVWKYSIYRDRGKG
jgi:hypothetical protein